MNIKIIKANSNGNSFVLIKNVSKDLLNSNQIINICNRHNTDGLILLNIININNITMDYYNNDGSWETLCINGLLCAGKLLNLAYKIDNIDITCNYQNYKIKIYKDSIEISIPRPIYKSKKIFIDNLKGYYLDSGAKHFIIHQKSIWPDNKNIINISRKIRYNKELFPDGININFYKVINNNTLEIKTYEKGIENLMESCASGSFACAFHYHYKNKLISPIHIINNGGNYLSTFNDNYKHNTIISNSIIEYEDNILL